MCIKDMFLYLRLSNLRQFVTQIVVDLVVDILQIVSIGLIVKSSESYLFIYFIISRIGGVEKPSSQRGIAVGNVNQFNFDNTIHVGTNFVVEIERFYL